MTKEIKEQFSGIQELILEKFELSNPEFETESKEYWACKFVINNQKIIYRKAKITPTKVGQFVTLWKRSLQGPIEPFHNRDSFDLVIIFVAKDKQFGQFVFPKSILVKKGVVSSNLKEGKRGFRVYPPWDETKNTQAKKTQEWQVNYFLSINTNSINVDKARMLFNLNRN